MRLAGISPHERDHINEHIGGLVELLEAADGNEAYRYGWRGDLARPRGDRRPRQLDI
jgi:hypothetical protein